MNLRPFYLLVLVASLASFAQGAEKPWIEVKSPHFRVLTNAPAGYARQVALEFEKLRAVFAIRYPGFRLDSSAPLLIFAAKDEDTARALAPALWRSVGFKLAGGFQHSWEKQYALVRLDLWGQGTRHIVYFDYTHLILALNSRWLPLWLGEGLAEFYSYTQFRENEVLLGSPTERFRVLRQHAPLPIEDFIGFNRRSPEYRDEAQIQLFSAESWALVHFLMFGPNMEGGKKLDDFFQRLQDGVDQKKAFVDVFGSFKSMDAALRDYLRGFALQAVVLKNPPVIDDKNFSTRTLSMAETQAEIGGYHIWTKDYDNARAYVTDALANDPKLGLAHEEKGFLDLHDAKDAESISEFTEALANDKSLYLSLFARTMMSPQATSSDRADQSIFRQGLTETLNLNLQFAPAFIQLARLAVRQNDLKTALNYSERAEKLEPSRAGYHTMSGQILLRMGRGREAAENAKFVADRYVGADHNEAVELWNSVPETERPAGVVVADWNPKDTARAEGTLKSVRCGDKSTWSLSLAQPDQTLTFHQPGHYLWGHADTLWYGQNHISICHHLEGLRTIVYYKPPSDSTYNGEIVELEIRDDLPPRPAQPDKSAATPVAPATAEVKK
jgi:tetratricopeptide (TPR) repeat protein